MLFKKSEEALLKALKLERNNTAVTYALFVVTLAAEKEGNKLRLVPKREAEEYALRLKKESQYMGYIAWAEVNLSREKKREFGIRILKDVSEEYKERPHAYLRLWRIYWEEKDYSRSLEQVEKLFLYMGSIGSAEIRTITALLYSKSLFAMEEYLRSFNLLQHEFSLNTEYSIFLYQFGKQAVRSKLTNFFGSAIGSLEECLRSCVEQRHSKVFYYIGLAYYNLGRPLTAFDWFFKCRKTLKSRGEAMKHRRLLKYLEEYMSYINIAQYVKKLISSG